MIDAVQTKWLGDLGRLHSLDEVKAYMGRMKDLRVLVLGEAIIDEYQYCTAIGKSSKEPTLVVKDNSTEKFAGGILAVANHVASFCPNVTMVTMLGDQNPQEEFIRSKMSPQVRCEFLRRKDAPTIVKKRIIEGYFFTKLLEIYQINDMDLDDADNRILCRRLEQLLPDHDLVIVVDYGHGLMSREAIDVLTHQAKFLAVNAQANAGNLGYHTISMYPHADFIAMTEGEIRLEARDRRGDLRNMVESVAGKLTCSRFVVTRGNRGCLCYDKEHGFVEVPAFAEKVVDRIGAGDAFLSVAALLAVQQAPLEVIGFVGNIAGAQAVATVGNKEPLNSRVVLERVETLLNAGV